MTININNKLIYVLAGAAAGMLLAPRSGREIRSALSGKIDDLRNRVQGRVQGTGIGEGLTDTMKNVVARGKNIASISRQRLNESIEAGKRKFNESIESFESFDRGDRDIASRW